MTWEDILKLSYAENRRMWDNQRNNRQTQKPSNKNLNVEGKSSRMNPQQLEFYKKQKEELKQYNPNADDKALHRMALRRTLKQYPNLQEA